MHKTLLGPLFKELLFVFSTVFRPGHVFCERGSSKCQNTTLPATNLLKVWDKIFKPHEHEPPLLGRGNREPPQMLWDSLCKRCRPTGCQLLRPRDKVVPPVRCPDDAPSCRWVWTASFELQQRGYSLHIGLWAVLSQLLCSVVRKQGRLWTGRGVEMCSKLLTRNKMPTKCEVEQKKKH